MHVKVTSVDKGYNALIGRLEKAARERTLTVGIHEEAGAASSGDTTVADIASINEFGLGVPARSFIGAWAEEREAQHKDDLGKLAQAVVKGSVADIGQGLEQLGEKYVGEVQSRIAGGISPPNAPATVARKGSSTPLIDTGVLRSSVTKAVK